MSHLRVEDKETSTRRAHREVRETKKLDIMLRLRMHNNGPVVRHRSSGAISCNTVPVDHIESLDKYLPMPPNQKTGSMHSGVGEPPQRIGKIANKVGRRDQILIF
jgi:hypothetical protein